MVILSSGMDIEADARQHPDPIISLRFSASFILPFLGKLEREREGSAYVSLMSCIDHWELPSPPPSSDATP